LVETLMPLNCGMTASRAAFSAARTSLRFGVKGNPPMLYWTAVFFIIALISAVLGFGGIAAGAAGIAKVLFFVFLVLGALSLIFGRRVPV
jgi:uncharacterized membrane protein YtjA (UPF0391 family)